MRIAMTLAHPWWNDSRVIREAEALAEAGHEVRVFCRGAGGTETHGRVAYVAIPDTDKGRLLRWLRLATTHFAILRIWHRDRFRIGVGCGTRHLAGTVRGFLRTFPIAIAAVVSKRYRESPAARRLAEPFFHLNDFAVAALPAIVEWRPDVVHVHDLACLSGGFLAARRLGAPFVFDAHELETHVNYRVHRGTRLFRSRYERALIREAAAVITVSESIADWLVAKYGIARPVVVLNVPAESSPHETDGDTVRKRLGLSDADELVVYVGSMNVDRGLAACVEALRFAPGVHFAVIGAREATIESGLWELARLRSVAERFHVVDPVPSREVVRFIRDADGSVVPIPKVCLSFQYCMPNKLFESVLAGLPVAFTRLKEMRAFHRELGIGLEMEESSPRAVAAAMTAITEDPERWRPSAGQIETVLRRYGWPVQKGRLLGLYAALRERARTRG